METDDEIARLDGLIAEEATALNALIYDRILPLMVSKRLLALARSLPDGAPEAAPVPDPEPKVPPAPPRRSVAAPVPPAPEPSPGGATVMLGKGVATWVMFEALAAGPEEGMSPNALDAMAADFGVSISGLKGGRAALRKANIAVFDDAVGLWKLLPPYRHAKPAGPRPKVGKAYEPADGALGRVLLAAMLARPDAPLHIDALAAATAVNGVSRNGTGRALGELRNAGYVISVGGDKWALTPKGLSRSRRAGRDGAPPAKG